MKGLDSLLEQPGQMAALAENNPSTSKGKKGSKSSNLDNSRQTSDFSNPILITDSSSRSDVSEQFYAEYDSEDSAMGAKVENEVKNCIRNKLAEEEEAARREAQEARESRFQRESERQFPAALEEQYSIQIELLCNQLSAGKHPKLDHDCSDEAFNIELERMVDVWQDQWFPEFDSDADESDSGSES